jgi:hypothetical protein
VVEGKTNTYTIALNSQPTANVTVSLASGNTAQGGTASPSSLTFTPANWNTAQTASFIGADDLVVDGNTTWTLTNSITSSDTVYAALPPVVLSMTTLDNEPVVTLPSGDVRYGIGQPGIGIDGRATISDPNSPNYASAKLTVTLTANGTADDRLEIRNAGTDAGQISVSGNTVSYGGTAIATFTGGTGTSPLVVTFNNSASPAAAQALLQSITFRNVNSNPSRNRRSVSFALAHSDGGVGTASTGIRVSLVRVADFQQEADHGYGAYTNYADIELYQLQPDTPLPKGHSTDVNNPQMWIDYRDADTPNQSEVLLRFDNLVGNGLGQIPSNAIIVSAELLLNVRDAGDGSPLYRMLIPWDATNETWNTMGNGIQPDDVKARSTYESALGVPAVSGDSGIGVVTVEVTADIQAWVNGETNYGWGMTTWNSEINPSWGNGTDGLGFRCGESPNIDDRPRLRVLWVPAGTASASFRQNVDNYTGTRDTRIRQSEPDTAANAATAVFVDAIVTGTTNNPDEVLIRFDEITGTNPGQVPPGALVEAATLDLATVSGNGYGDGGQFFAMLTPWQDTDTWNTLGGGIQTNGVQAASSPTVVAGSPALDPNVCGGYMSFEVTPDVQAWSSGTRTNYGWAILPWNGGGDGWAVSMSESAAENERPRLRVYYSLVTVPVDIVLQPPVVSPSSVQVKFSGAASQSYYVLRAAAVTGPWTTNGTTTTDPTGKATYTDNSPLPASAFYRVYQP